MNRKMTPYLLAALLVLGVLALLAERPRRGAESPARQAEDGARTIEVPRDNVLRIGMKQDYWNSYILARDDTGRWMMEEPARAPVIEREVRLLWETLTALPIVRALDVPGHDAERRREYGLWTPTLELSLHTTAGVTTLLFGARTPDDAGVYVAVHGEPTVYVTAASAFDILRRNADTYRLEP